MMYLKQFPDICREMGFDVEEKAKTITLRITDINYSNPVKNYSAQNYYTGYNDLFYKGNALHKCISNY